MALPRLRDYLPSQDLASGFDLRVPDVEQALKAFVDRFVSDLENAADLKEKHIEEAVQQLAEERARNRASRSAVTIFDLGIRRLLELRDRLLVQEAQHLSMSAFWDDDD